MTTRTLEPEVLHKMDAYWRAANYLSVGQIYLCDNPLLKRPLQLSDVKPLVVGHWGTTPGQNFIYAHLNRVITKYDLDMFYVADSVYGGPALVVNTYLEGCTTITPTTQAHRGTHQKGGGRRGPNSARTRGPQTLVPSAGAFQD
jgi:phosphoketolase